MNGLDDLLRSAEQGLGLHEEDDFDPTRCKCHLCGQTYNGSDSSGGHCMAPLPGGGYCCQSFGSDSLGKKHRVGPYEPPGQRRCLTPDEMRGKGWHQDSTGAWRWPAPENPHYKKDAQ